MPEYPTDRLAALEKSASLHYQDIPDAPLKELGKKPHRSMKAAVPAHIQNLLKNVEKAEIALGNLNESTRADLLEIQGEEMRRQLLEAQDKIAKLLEVMPQPVENKESEGV